MAPEVSMYIYALDAISLCNYNEDDFVKIAIQLTENYTVFY